MPNFTHPGVYLQEASGVPAPIRGSSPSTMGICGFTDMGPENTPTLVNGMKDFERIFGQFLATGLVPLVLSGFFANGGQQAMVSRVVGAGAAQARAYIAEAIVGEDTGMNGDGTDTTLAYTLDELPVQRGSISIPYRYDGTPISAAVIGTGNNATVIFTYQIPEANLPIKPGSVTVNFTDTTPKSQTDNGTGGFTGDGLPGSSTINYTTGAVTANLTGTAPDAATPVTITYTPLKAATVTDDGAGALAGGASGTIDYTTGELAAVFAHAPTAKDVDNAGYDVLVSYGQTLYELRLKWKGAKGNDFQVQMFGTPGEENDAVASFNKWTVSFAKLNANDEYIVQESFSGLDFTDTDSDTYFPKIINDSEIGSEIFEVIETANTGVPSVLKGTVHSSVVFGTGTGVATYTATLGFPPLAETTLTLRAPKATNGEIMVVTDDGNGSLNGDIGAGVQSVNYTTGAVTVIFEANVAAASSNILADYYTAAAKDGRSPYTSDARFGSDGSPVAASDIVDASLEAGSTGLYAFNKVDDLLSLVIPDFAGEEIVDQVLIDYCDSRADRFAILAEPEGLGAQEGVNYRRRVLQRNSSRAALYTPWLKVKDPITKLTITIPPVGHIAGIYARTDDQKNVGKAPAGQEDGAIRGIVGLERSYTQAEVGTLYGYNINAIVDWKELPQPAVWGARTLQLNGEFGYINYRRLFMYVEKAIYGAMFAEVFSNNGPDLWERVRFKINSFLLNLFNAGYFAGDVASDAFYIIVDATNNPPESVALGILNVEVGLAPNTPAEFISLVFRRQLPG